MPVCVYVHVHKCALTQQMQPGCCAISHVSPVPLSAVTGEIIFLGGKNNNIHTSRTTPTRQLISDANASCGNRRDKSLDCVPN